ncbi:hypothetical protein [Agreia sp.]|uniref:A1S_2505 family phage non-structural protein n=1 Tax=Agreia sp. TaxID=1872416 RepID=UPI0035BC5D08
MRRQSLVKRIAALEPGEIFVFGSNASGHHGAGAAAQAQRDFGAVWGEGHGLHGQSYAIDTMSGLGILEREIGAFVDFAETRPDLTFLVTEIGCGIAGYMPADVAPLFPRVPLNVRLPESFVSELSPGR